MNDKDQELIAIAASIAAGCVPCTQYHFRAARIAGAQDAELQQAVNDALCVRRNATAIMASLAQSRPRPAGDVANACCEDKPLLSELVSVAAAYAINCVADLEKHMAAARRQGATDEQILAALKIACAIEEVAGKKVQATAAKALRATENDSEVCGCQSDASQSEHQDFEAPSTVNA